MAIQLDTRYQVEAYQKICDSLRNTKRAGIIMPTGTGKSFIALKLIEDRYKTDKQILYVSSSPTINSRIRKLIIENYTKEESKMILSKLKFTTYHAIQNRYKNNKEAMSEYNSDTIILDEVHRSGAPEWGKAISYLLDNNPSANILGMTATPLRTDGQNMIEKRCGNVTYELKISEAVAMGILKMPVYISARHIFKEDIKSLEEKLELIDNEQERKDLERKLNDIKKRIAEGENLDKIYQKYLEPDGRYIVFCNPGDDIESLQEQAKKKGIFNGVNLNQEFLIIESARGEVKNKIALAMFERKKNGVLRLLYVKNMLNEGYHDKEHDDYEEEFINEEVTGEIMTRPTKSYGLYIQQLGRVLSKNRKKPPIVLDIVGNMRYFKEFRLEVQRIIKEGKARGEIKYDEKVLESFKILEEEEDFVRAFEEIEQSISRYMNIGFNIEDAINEIENWCIEKFQNVPIYNRRLPRRVPGVTTAKNTVNPTEEEIESRLNILNGYIRQSDIYIRYKEGRVEELTEHEIEIMKRYQKLVDEYNYKHLNIMAKNIEDIEKWCIENNKGKPIYLRVMPTANPEVLIGKNGNEKTDEQKEKSLAAVKHKIEHSDIYIKYKEGRLDELKIGEIQLIEKYAKIKEKYDYRYLNILARKVIELEKWCEEKNKGKLPEEYVLPHRKRLKAPKNGKKETEGQREERLARYFFEVKKSDIYIKYITGKKDELSKAEIELIERYIENVEKYKKNELELKIDEIETWCKEKFEGKSRYLRRLPKRDDSLERTNNKQEETEEQRENRLGQLIHKLEQRQLKMYLAGDISELDYKDIEQLERFLRLKKEYDVSNLEVRITKVGLWCKEKFKGQPLFLRRLPRICIKKDGKDANFSNLDEESEEYEELKLGQDRANIQKKYKKYKEGKLDELTEEEIELLKKYDELVEEYNNESLNTMGETLIELEEWCKYNKRFPRSTVISNGNKTFAAENREMETEEQKEQRLGVLRYQLGKREFYKKYKEGKINELTKAEIEFVERYLKIEEKYKNKISGQDIGEATFDAPVNDCDKAHDVLSRLVSRTTEKGEKNSGNG